jgi:signal transduction histidine kinase
MRLLTKTFLYYISFAAVIFALGGVISYFLIGNIFYRQLDEGMITEKDIITQEINSNSHVPDYSSRFGHQIEVVLLDRKLSPRFYMKDTTISSGEKEEDFRYLYFSANRSKNRAYTIEIFHPLNETTNLIEDILLVTFVMFAFLFLVLIAVNYFVSRRIWVPFYTTIGQLSRYNINEKDTLTLTTTPIYEFTVLNKVITDMSEKIMTDYFNMKEFTENASHEIQTPLAVIKSKVEMLLQDEDLDKKQVESLQTINDSVSRLTRLNAGLVLLSKIEKILLPFSHG